MEPKKSIHLYFNGVTIFVDRLERWKSTRSGNRYIDMWKGGQYIGYLKNVTFKPYLVDYKIDDSWDDYKAYDVLIK